MSTIYGNDQPGLGLTVEITLQGIYPSRGGSGSATAGLLGVHVYAFSPRGGSVAQDNGQLLTIQSNTPLYSLLGIMYGGNGTSTFALPDFRGRVDVGASATAPIGQATGTQSTTLTATNYPVTVGGADQPFSNVQPELSLNYYINVTGIFPSGSPTADTLGVVQQFAGNFAPDGTMLADGRLLNISQYQALFAILGVTYGGDGRTTFALPNLVGRVPVGADAYHPVGTAFGSDQTTLSTANLPGAMGGSGAAVDTHEESLAMNYLIATQGVYPSPDSVNTQYTTMGEVFLYAGAYLPDGFTKAAGQVVSIAQNSALFSLLGTTYGGDGQTTFNLPDLSGRAVVGTGTGTGLSSVQLGQQIGTDSFTIGINDFGPLGINGTAAADVRYGANQGDFIYGLAGDDILYGNGGDDTIDGGTGADHMYGGAGNDIYYVDNAADVVVENANEGIDEVRTSLASYALPANVEKLTFTGLVAPTSLAGNSGDNVIALGDNGGIIDVSQGGNDTVTGGAGEDGFYFGAALTALDHVDGGAGSNDQVAIRGDYTGANRLVLGATTLINVEVLAAQPGYSYSIVWNDGDAPAGTKFSVYGGQLGAADNLTFDGSNETNASFVMIGGGGVDTLTGGALDDGFYFGPGNWGANDVVHGGGGTNNQIGLDGDYTIHATGNMDVQVLALIPGAGNHFNITVDDSFIAAGATKTITANTTYGTVYTALTINGAAEQDGSLRLIGGTAADTLTGGHGADLIFGGLGGDTLTGGAGADRFYYDDAAQSTSTGYDTLVDFDPTGGDRIQIAGTTAAHGYASVTAALGTSSFDADLAAAVAAKLGTTQAVLVTGAAGSDLAGQVFLVVEGSAGHAGYQAGEDYVFHLPAVPNTTTDFITG